MLKILEHCCYLKYLNQWYLERRSQKEQLNRFLNDPENNTLPDHLPADNWQLVHYGDHMMLELLEWCMNTLWCKRGLRVTVAMPALLPRTLENLSKLRQVTELGIITAKTPCDEVMKHFTKREGVRAVQINDVHMQCVTVSALDGSGAIVLHGGLLQQLCPGKYIVNMLFGQSNYEEVQEQLDSLLRVYSRVRKHQD